MQKGIPVPYKRAQQCLGIAISIAGVIFGCGISTSITLGTVPGVHNDMFLRFLSSFNYYIMIEGDCQPVQGFLLCKLLEKELAGDPFL